MEYEEEARRFNFVVGVVCGALVGAGVALVLAPYSGRNTRRRIQRVAGDLKETAADRWEEISDERTGRVEEALGVDRGKLF
jgi:gas vesicle protein